MPEATQRRGGRVPLRWHVARWRDAEPGRRGFLWMGVLTVLTCVPIERLGFDIPWTTQTSLFLNAGIVVAAVLVGREAALPDDVERWLVNQGHSPADWVLARWSANLLPIAALSLLWTLAVAVVTVAMGQHPAWGPVLGLLAQLVISAALLTLVLLVVGAAGVRQTSEILLLVLIATFLLPLAGDRIPEPVMRGLLTVLPPAGDVGRFREALVHAEWGDAGLAFLRLATWSAVVLGVALALSARRIPERGPRVAAVRR